MPKWERGKVGEDNGERMREGTEVREMGMTYTKNSPKCITFGIWVRLLERTTSQILCHYLEPFKSNRA